MSTKESTIEIGNREFYVLRKEDLRVSKWIRERRLETCMSHIHNPTLPLAYRLELAKEVEKLNNEIKGIEQLLTLPVSTVIFVEIALLSSLAK